MRISQLEHMVDTFVALAKKKGGRWRKKLPKGWSSKSRKKYWESLVGDSEHPVTDCMEKMEGKMKNPGAFCAPLKDIKEKTTKWRGKKKKDKKKKKKATAAIDKGRWTIIREYNGGEHIGWYIHHPLGGPKPSDPDDVENGLVPLEDILDVSSWEGLSKVLSRQLAHLIHKAGVGPTSEMDPDGNYIGAAGWLDQVSERPWGEKHDVDPKETDPDAPENLSWIVKYKLTPDPTKPQVKGPFPYDEALKVRQKMLDSGAFNAWLEIMGPPTAADIS